MIWDYAVKGILIGLIFGVPVGAIGALTIQRAIDRGFWAGILTGAGSSATSLSFMIAFTAFEITGNLSIPDGCGLIAGILGWWAVLSGGVCIFRKRMTDSIYRWMNRILGEFPAGFSMLGSVAPLLVIPFLFSLFAWVYSTKLSRVGIVELVSEGE